MLAVSAAGTGASMMAAQEQAAAQKRAMRQGMEEERRIQNKANDRTQEYVKDTFDPTNRAANYEQQAAKQEQSFGELLAKQAIDGQGAINDATAGAVSDTYTRAKAQAEAGAAERARTLSRLMARSGATGGLYGQEAMTGADYASDMMGYGVDSRLNSNRTNARYGAAGSKGQGLALLGGLMSGAAGSMGTGKRDAFGGTAGYLYGNGRLGD